MSNASCSAENPICGLRREGKRRALRTTGGKDGRETLLLLHGSAGSGALWREQARTFAPDLRVLAPDLIGYGASPPWPEARPFDLADEVRQVRPLLPCCGRSVHVVGYSYGGAVALALAEAEPAMIKTLTLIEPVFFSALRRSGGVFAYSQFQEVRARFSATVAKGEHDDAMRGFIEFWTGPGSWDALEPAVRQGMISQVTKISLDWEASFAFDPAASLLHRLGRRTLLVRGDRSPIPMIHLVDALHALMHGSRLLVARGANHMLPLTRGAWLTESLAEHMRVWAEPGAAHE